MARIDKVDPYGGLFRAPLAGSWAGSATPIGVGLDSNGRVVAGAGQTGVVGVLCEPKAFAAGEVVDIVKIAELVEFGGVAGTVYVAHTTDGAITAAAVDATHVMIGYTVEAARLIVQVDQTQGADTDTDVDTAATSTYTPADTTKWTGPDPTTVAAALDRIAAALGPIA